MMDFQSTLFANGLRPTEIIADGEFHRCATDDHPRKKNGFYKLALDGRVGWFGNFAISEDAITWKADEKTLAILPQRSREEIERQAAERRRIAGAAIAAMRSYWSRLKPLAGSNPYLEVKGLSMLGCDQFRRDGDILVVPMLRAGSLISVQKIYPNGKKLYWEDAPAKGAYLALKRTNSTVTIFAEGVATALALFQSIPTASVYICFTASNILTVATELSVSGMTVVAADNDWETAEKNRIRTGLATNPGLEAGIKASDAVGCGLAYPEGIKGSDWCDALIEWEDPYRVRMEVLKQARVVYRSQKMALSTMT